MIRVLAVDDHPVVRDGIARLIGTQSDMELIAEASDGGETSQELRIRSRGARIHLCLDR